MPLARTQLLAFFAPVVKGATLTIPVVAANGDRHELVASTALMREFGITLVAATEPAALFAARQSANRTGAAVNHAQAAAAGRPLEKPKGGVL